jgi:hypothetical protein
MGTVAGRPGRERGVLLKPLLWIDAGRCERAYALEAYAETSRALYAEANMPPAEWVQMLSELAKREASS